MERCMLRHRSGSLAGQELELSEAADLVLGRDPEAAVRFDGQDDLVSRRHARIHADGPRRFAVTDLQSRNGTYVNRQRIAGTVVLAHGDVVQLGPGGPEVEFVLDPPPLAAGATRTAETAIVGPTVAAPAFVPPPVRPAVPAHARGVGRATIERLIGEAHGANRRRLYQIGGAAAAAVIVLAGAGWYGVTALQQRTSAAIAGVDKKIDDQKPTTMTAAQIAAKYAPSTVQVEFGWKLIFTPTGEQVYVQRVPQTDQRGRVVRDESGRPRLVPLYLRLPDGSMEPALTLDKGKNSENIVVGGASRGSGFVVGADGFILTNGHVAASWNHENFWRSLGPGILVDVQARKILGQIEQIPKWIPTASRLLGQRPVEGRNLAGRHDYLDVVFPHKNLRVPAKLSRESNNHDVALIKIDVTAPLTPIPLFDNFDAAALGSPIVVLGYPGLSENPVAISRSQDPLADKDRVSSVPDPTVTPGVISRVYHGTPAAGVNPADFASNGEHLQLTANPGGGNSGGPLFDDQGRAIGVFYAGVSGPEYGYAVPIRYAQELLGTGRTLTR